MLERLGLALLHRLDPERAHDLALRLARAGLAYRTQTPTSPRLQTSLGPLRLPNPVGLAAGLDKNAVAVAPLLRAGFGFVEVGAVTPRPQPGNARPRLFRLPADRAIINRFGFNNDGVAAVARRLERRPGHGIVGINLGSNKDSEDRAADFAAVLRDTGPFVDFATVNVSSPNTENLRDLQGRDALAALLDRVLDQNAKLARPVPVFLKVAPDLTQAEIDDIAEVALASGLAGLFATNTTLRRDGLTGPHRQEAGGLSGAPLFDLSTRVLAQFASRLDGRLPLVGIGGISDTGTAMAKIEAGASAVQLYSALVYRGLSLASAIARGMDAELAARGIASLTDLTGARAAELAAKPAP